MERGFLDVRTHGFARVAVVVPEVRVADPAFNVAAHLRLLARARDEGAQYAVCPELGLSGYSCGDLFFQETLLSATRDALGRLAEATRDWPMAVSVGAPVVVDGALFNCALTLAAGRLVAVAPKAYPPNYREFYEGRWFAPAAAAASEAIELLGQTVPFGTDVLMALTAVPGFVLHTEICEDLWVPIPPSTLAALAGATVLSNLSASNVTIGKADYRRDLVRMSSAKNLAAQLYSAAGHGESTADLAWDGHGLVADRGDVVAERILLRDVRRHDAEHHLARLIDVVGARRRREGERTEQREGPHERALHGTQTPASPHESGLGHAAASPPHVGRQNDFGLSGSPDAQAVSVGHTALPPSVQSTTHTSPSLPASMHRPEQLDAGEPALTRPFELAVHELFGGLLHAHANATREATKRRTCGTLYTLSRLRSGSLERASRAR